VSTELVKTNSLHIQEAKGEERPGKEDVECGMYIYEYMFLYKYIYCTL